jgi:anti-sigma B factor antagonist
VCSSDGVRPADGAAVVRSDVPGPGADGRSAHRASTDEPLLRMSASVADPAHPDVAHVALSGELCPFGAPALGRLLESLVDDGIRHVDIDVAGLELCTAAGVTLFEAVHDRVLKVGGSLRVVGAHGVVRRVFEVASPQLATEPADSNGPDGGSRAH